MRTFILGLVLVAAACTSVVAPVKLGPKGERCDGSTGYGGCLSGLVCAHDGICQDPQDPGATGTTAAGDACSRDGNCQYLLICNSQWVCGRAGNGTAGATCTSRESCGQSLVCAADGTCQDPADPDATGVAGRDEVCAGPADCQLGLLCFVDSTCQPLEVWAGADCTASDEDEADPDSPFRVYFEVPRAGAGTDFYRLPFPNDIRLKNGRVDLSGHPVPDTPLTGLILGKVIDAIQDENDGFSTQAAVLLRFSKRLNFDTLDLTSAQPNLILVNIDPASDHYGRGPGVSMFATTRRGKYICQNWLSMKPLDGYPLQHSTTYAVIVTAGIKSSEGTDLVRDADFEAMLAASAPSDSDLRAAWTSYQPLRDYLADAGQVTVAFAESVMAAAVFTTLDPDSVMQGFGTKIASCAGADCDKLPAPEPVGLTLESQDQDAAILSGTVRVPVFQKGTPPYLQEGGDIEFDAGHLPVIQRSEEVAFRLMVPKGVPPPEGWPLVLFAHGTGGGPQSFIDDGVAARLASVQVPLGAAPETARFAVLGIEAVQHGSRRGETTLSPDVLYFNFLNPRAAKYNAIQGAADNFQLLRLVQALHDAPLAVDGLDDPVVLDPSHIAYFGHSQGSLSGPLFLAYTAAVKTVVLSGAGGNLTLSLLGKTKPLDVAALVRLLLNEPDAGELNPMLNLLQLYFDPIDPVNYGRDLTFTPVQIGETQDDPPQPIYGGPKHLFMSFGRDDSYSCENTLVSFARSMGLKQIQDPTANCDCHEACDAVDGQTGLHQAPCNILGLNPVPPPARATHLWNGQEFTAVLKLYLPVATDGHFVLFNHPAGPDDYALFLGSAVVDPEGIPTLFE